MMYRIMRKILSIMDLMGSLISGYFMRSAGVLVGKNVHIYGMPILSLFNGSRIILGNNVILRSRSQGNAIGFNHRIVFTTLSSEACINIGDHVGISGGAICCKGRVTIGDYTLLGANTIIADNDMHSIDPDSRLHNDNIADIPYKEVNIGKNVWVGADVFICKGVSIGDNSVIGAKSLVSKSIPENCIAAGNPAVVIKKNIK